MDKLGWALVVVTVVIIVLVGYYIWYDYSHGVSGYYDEHGVPPEPGPISLVPLLVCVVAGFGCASVLSLLMVRGSGEGE